LRYNLLNHGHVNTLLSPNQALHYTVFWQQITLSYKSLWTYASTVCCNLNATSLYANKSDLGLTCISHESVMKLLRCMPYVTAIIIMFVVSYSIRGMDAQTLNTCCLGCKRRRSLLSSQHNLEHAIIEVMNADSVKMNIRLCTLSWLGNWFPKSMHYMAKMNFFCRFDCIV